MIKEEHNMINDKRFIWEDCPACAHKHLTAAYAILTSVPFAKVPEAWEIYAARANIAYREYCTGYLGNLSLAIGCLHAAEGERDLPEGYAEVFRTTRLGWQSGVWKTEVYFPSPPAFVFAHVTEALRELPSLWEAFEQVLGGKVNDEGEDLRDTLRRSIHGLEELYCLGQYAVVRGAEHVE